MVHITLIQNVFFTLGQPACTMNIYLLIHLSACVRDWGPLWAYSCFPFEGMNCSLKKLFHGSRNMSEQVHTCNVMTNGGCIQFCSCVSNVDGILLCYEPDIANYAGCYCPPRVQAFLDQLLGKKRFVTISVLHQAESDSGHINTTN